MRRPRAHSTNRLGMLVVAFALLASVAPVVPAVAAPTPGWRFSTVGTVIERDGRDWMLEMYGAGSDSGGYISVDVTYARDPDGGGPLRAEQLHSWSFDVPGGAMEVDPQTLLGHVDTGGRLGDFGRVRLVFGPRDGEPRDPGCFRDGQYHEWTRDVAITGGFVDFRTDNAAWGRITRRPTRAEIFYGDGACTHPSPPSCAIAGTTLNSYRQTEDGDRSSITTRESPGSPIATIQAYRQVDMGIPGDGRGGAEQPRMDLYNSLYASVPQERVHVEPDLGVGRVLGGGSADAPGWDMVSGAATFEATGPLNDPTWINCPEGMRYRQWNRPGQLTPGHGQVEEGLRVDFIGFADWALPGAGVATYASRNEVGPRP